MPVVLLGSTLRQTRMLHRLARPSPYLVALRVMPVLRARLDRQVPLVKQDRWVRWDLWDLWVQPGPLARQEQPELPEPQGPTVLMARQERRAQLVRQAQLVPPALQEPMGSTERQVQLELLGPQERRD
jgi:hypothetical protein